MPSSRYGVTTQSLSGLSKVIQIGGQGLAQRISTLDGTQMIVEAENWADSQVSTYLAVPLKPVAAPGQVTIPNPPTSDNYPTEFILAIRYSALSRLLGSELSASLPDASQISQTAEAEAYRLIFEFRSRVTNRVGAGRRRHPNPHMPPNIAPPEQMPNNQQF